MITGGTGSFGNAVLNRIKADITQVPIRVPEFKEAELLGDLCVALTALGQFPDPATAAESLVIINECYEPDPLLKDLYDELFGLYRRSYRSLKDVFSGLSELSRKSSEM